MEISKIFLQRHLNIGQADTDSATGMDLMFLHGRPCDIQSFAEVVPLLEYYQPRTHNLFLHSKAYPLALNFASQKS